MNDTIEEKTVLCASCDIACQLHAEVQAGRVVRVKSHGVTEDGHLRAAVFQGARADVRPEECTAGPNDEIAHDVPSLGGEDRVAEMRDAAHAFYSLGRSSTLETFFFAFIAVVG